MPRPKKENTLTDYSVPEMDYKWMQIIERMNKLRLVILSYKLNPHKKNTIMCFLKEMEQKLELLNGK